jgi:hypothetical protein
MVRRVVLSQYTSDPPDQAGRVKINRAGPIYDLEQVFGLAEEALVQLWTRKCIQNVRDLYETVREEYDSDLAMVVDLLKRLRTSGRYQDSEWCENGRGGIAACDAYEVQRSDYVPAIRQRVQTRYFVKFAVGKTGQVLLLVACHV